MRTTVEETDTADELAIIPAPLRLRRQYNGNLIDGVVGMSEAPVNLALSQSAESLSNSDQTVNEEMADFGNVIPISARQETTCESARETKMPSKSSKEEVRMLTFDEVQKGGNTTINAVRLAQRLESLGVPNFQGGFFLLFYANCEPSTLASFDIRVSLYNVRTNGKKDYLVLTYEKNSNDLRVQVCENGDLDYLGEEFSDGRIQYAFARVVDPNSKLPKFVLINW